MGEAGRNGISCICLPQLNLLEQTLSSYKSFMEEDWIDWGNDVLCIGSKICFDDVRRTTSPEVVRQFIEKGVGDGEDGSVFNQRPTVMTVQTLIQYTTLRSSQNLSSFYQRNTVPSVVCTDVSSTSSYLTKLVTLAEEESSLAHYWIRRSVLIRESS